jgi:predicted transport protein
MWKCPNCGRSFRNTNQDHSCIITDLETHFVNKQQNVIDAYAVIKSEAMKLDGVKINSVKNAILFQAKSNFLAVKPKKTHLDIEFVLNERIEEFPIYKTFQATKSKIAHFVRLKSSDEVDEQLISWLKMAFKSCN